MPFILLVHNIDESQYSRQMRLQDNTNEINVLVEAKRGCEAILDAITYAYCIWGFGATEEATVMVEGVERGGRRKETKRKKQKNKTKY